MLSTRVKAVFYVFWVMLELAFRLRILLTGMNTELKSKAEVLHPFQQLQSYQYRTSVSPIYCHEMDLNP